MPDSHQISRRGFVNLAVGFVGSVITAVIGLPAIGYLVSPVLKQSRSDAWIQLGPPENYPVGIPTPFTFTRTKINGWEKTVNSYGVYVLRGEDGSIKVYSNVCTHLACRVKWSDERKLYLCPCHDAAFNLDGSVAGGPPPRPLDVFAEVKTENNILSFRFLEG
jgi:menaquinol-cytochrome c reductase iron-sulfur subunit